MKAHVNYAMCSCAILKMNLGMLAAQLLRKTVARDREEQQYQGLMKSCANYAMCSGAILKGHWDAVSITAGKTAARNREEQQYQGLMKSCVNFTMCALHKWQAPSRKWTLGCLQHSCWERLLPEIQ
jgi:hypothetical protein